MQNLNKYIGKLDSKFPNNDKKVLGDYIVKSKKDYIVPKETLVIMPLNGAVSLKILEEDTPEKSFSTPLQLNEQGIEVGLTANYLLWYLKQSFVSEYLISTTKGAVIPRVPKQVLYELKIPLPIHKKNITNTTRSEIIALRDNRFKKLISSFYEDYRLNFEKNRYGTCVILAGAIGEAILYQLLLDNEVDVKILEKDNTLGFGKLVNYIKLLKLDVRLDNFPLNHFEELQKHRNSAIHVGLAIKRKELFKKEDLVCFDQIIKYFGI